MSWGGELAIFKKKGFYFYIRWRSEIQGCPIIWNSHLPQGSGNFQSPLLVVHKLCVYWYPCWRVLSHKQKNQKREFWNKVKQPANIFERKQFSSKAFFSYSLFTKFVWLPKNEQFLSATKFSFINISTTLLLGFSL